MQSLQKQKIFSIIFCASLCLSPGVSLFSDEGNVAARGGGGGGHGGGGFGGEHGGGGYGGERGGYHGGDSHSYGHDNYNHDNYNHGNYQHNDNFNRNNWGGAGWEGGVVVPGGEYVLPGAAVPVESGDMDTLYDYENSESQAGVPSY